MNAGKMPTINMIESDLRKLSCAATHQDKTRRNTAAGKGKEERTFGQLIPLWKRRICPHTHTEITMGSNGL